jgi:Flp pilus assembly protein TadG
MDCPERTVVLTSSSARCTESAVVRTRAAGQALIEFAVILPVLLVMLLGMIDLGRGFVFGVATQDAARQAARVAANARLDPSLTDSMILQRLIDSSAPAMAGCTLPASITSTPVSLTCPPGAGTWTLTLVVTPAGSAPASTFAGLSSAARTHLNGGTVEVKAVGSVSLLSGFSTGAMGLRLYGITVQGDAAMVLL